MPGPPRPLPPPRTRTSPTIALASLAASLLVVNAAFWLWPDVGLPAGVVPEAPPPREMVALEMVEVTVQPPAAPLPPAPPPPPVVPDAVPTELPDDVIVDEIVRDLPIRVPPTPVPTAPSRPAIPGPPGPPAPPPPTSSAPRIVEAPDRSPRLVRASLPVYPAEAQRAGVRARATVRVLISEGGQVLEARVIERVLLDGRDRETVVSVLPHGLEQAALEAAHRHLFRPARDGGDRVRAYATLSLSFDPPR